MDLVHEFPRGKVLGGTSAINYMLYVRGQSDEYDDWARITGYQNWAWSGLRPYFLKHESLTAPAPVADHDNARLKTKRAFETESHGTSGPIKTSFGNWSAPVEDLWHDASKAMGLPWEPPKDAWSGSHLGGYSSLSMIDRSHGPGIRSYSASGYLVPNAKRQNLVVLTEGLVAKVVLAQNGEKPIATGVVFLRNGQEYTVTAKYEVVLAAGVVQTPQILELSGVGKKEVLSSAGVQTVVENDSVGEHFEDHPVIISSYNLVDGEFSLDHMTQEAILSEAMQKYRSGQGGPLANGVNANGFVAIAQVATPEEMKRINEAVSVAKDSARDRWVKEERALLAERVQDPRAASIQFTFLAASVNPGGFYDQEAVLAPSIEQSRCSIITGFSHPFSRGSIHIQSAYILG